MTTTTKLLEEIDTLLKELKQQKKKFKETIKKEKEAMEKNPASEIKIETSDLIKLKKELKTVVNTFKFYNLNTEEDYSNN